MRPFTYGRLLLLLKLSLAALVVLAAILIYYASTLPDSGKMVSHTLTVQVHIARLRSAVCMAEDEQRNYLITGNQDALEMYHSGMNKTLDEYGQLTALTADNGVQQANLAKLKPVLAERFAYLMKGVTFIQQGQREGAFKAIVAGRGRQLMTQIDASCIAMNSEEARLLKYREKKFRHGERAIQVISVAVLIFVASVIVGAIHIAKKGLQDARELDVMIQTINLGRKKER